jgi:hypothetical protein
VGTDTLTIFPMSMQVQKRLLFGHPFCQRSQVEMKYCSVQQMRTVRTSPEGGYNNNGGKITTIPFLTLERIVQNGNEMPGHGTFVGCWNGGSRFWPNWNKLEWRKLILD